MSDIAELTRRIARTEARQAIGELPARYAIAIDSRDMDGWVNLFVEDVDCGRRGKGREALRTFIEPSVRKFYRSIHHICGHVVDFIDDDTATGTVYCRAEHEDGDKWVVMAIIYFDRYVRRSGQWYFERRQEKHWYSADVLERPAPPFQLWDKWADRLPDLPGDFPTWSPFWSSMDKDAVDALTRQP
ncbi:MAG: nuclear transport factor 2 family protein [Novosphingobium sp.]